MQRSQEILKSCQRFWGGKDFRSFATNECKDFYEKDGRFLCSNAGQLFIGLNDFQKYDMEYGILQMWLQMNDMHSVESRSPLLDFRLLKYLNNNVRIR